MRYGTKLALRSLGRRVLDSTPSSTIVDDALAELVAATAPELLALHGVGVDTAAILLVAAGDNPERIRSEAAWAHLCGVAPIPASIGQDHGRHPAQRRRQPPGQPRALADRDDPHEQRPPHPPLRRNADVEEGLTKREIIRVLKRYVARETWRHLPHADHDLERRPGPITA